MEILTGFEKTEEEGEERLHGYKLVPWLSWDQWNFVRDSLFSSSHDSIDTALKRVSAWKSRGCLPVTMEVTAAIIEVQQKDPLFRKGTVNELEDSEEMLAMLYTMAIMRLVNGVVEKTRKQRDVLIAEAAESIGLPRMLIDIRHDILREIEAQEEIWISTLRGVFEGTGASLQGFSIALKAGLLDCCLTMLSMVSQPEGDQEALEWLKSYYWEPQKNAIPFQKDVASIRKEIKTKLRELAFHLSIRQASELGSLPMKGRRVKQPETLRGRNKFFSHMADRLKASNSGGSKKQITRTLGALVQIYYSFPSEVVSAMLQFLLKALDNSSDGNEVASVDNSDVEPSQENFRIFTGTTDVWEIVIARFLSKQPELLLTILEAILEKIETQGAMTLDTGDQLAPAQNNTGIREIEYLTSVVKWLIETFEKERHRIQKGSGDKIQDSSAETDDVLKPTLKELLRKCLLVLSPSNSQLAESAVLLAQMLGNNSMAERLKKLGMLRLENVDFVRKCSTISSLEKVLQQEKSITQAAEKLKSLKQQRMMKGHTLNTEARTGDNEEKESIWTVAKSWNPCPIGMLPRSLGSTGVLPILDKAIVTMPEDKQASQDKKGWEQNCCCGKRKASSDDESLLENSIVIEKKRREMVEVVPQDNEGSSVEFFKGHLRVGGAWMKVREEDVLAIASAVRILV